MEALSPSRARALSSSFEEPAELADRVMMAKRLPQFVETPWAWTLREIFVDQNFAEFQVGHWSQPVSLDRGRQ